MRWLGRWVIAMRFVHWEGWCWVGGVCGEVSWEESRGLRGDSHSSAVSTRYWKGCWVRGGSHLVRWGERWWVCGISCSSVRNTSYWKVCWGVGEID